MSLWTRVKSVGDALWAPSKVGFGPGEPLSPVAPSEQPRRADYQVGRNMLVSPRASESRSVTFSQMRQLARIHGVLRTVIEKRKDELKGLEWTIAVKPEFMGKGYEPEAKEALKFFEKPDLENTFDQWLGMLTEDIFVIDAPCLFKERDRLGNLRSLQVIDGSTILVLVDDRGRVPAPPQMAYEQKFKADVIGQSVEKTTFTAAISNPTSLTPIVVDTGKLYIDTSWASLGNTEKASTIVDFNWKISEGVLPFKALNGSLSYTDRSEKKRHIELEGTFAFNAVTNDLWANFTAQTPIFARLQFTGPAITGGNSTFVLDGCYVIDSFGALEDKDGLDVVKLKLVSIKDAISAKEWQAVLTNSLATMP
ncbi:hypothetical protein [Dehalococcoides mccartyi]|uniref:hypothetical protein n=1 Tax=Dehalococcoides mccartyi TaxID=61435 RepID=UPI00339AFFB2